VEGLVRRFRKPFAIDLNKCAVAAHEPFPDRLEQTGQRKQVFNLNRIFPTDFLQANAHVQAEFSRTRSKIGTTNTLKEAHDGFVFME
jgi:hypothetical protein